ncbi:MAG: XkdF-like putative serine protease domain-containing protein [Planctomycetota bacterium]
MTFQAAGRIKTHKVRKADGMSEGLVWVEAYLPLDIESYAQFQALVVKHGSAVQAAAINPELASKALTPVDAHGEAMLPEGVVQLAHGFITNCRKIDVLHNEQVRNDVQVVESFVNGPEIASPNFWPGSWVCVLKVDPASELFPLVESEQLDAVSFQGWVVKTPVVINVEALEAAA